MLHAATSLAVLLRLDASYKLNFLNTIFRCETNFEMRNFVRNFSNNSVYCKMREKSTILKVTLKENLIVGCLVLTTAGDETLVRARCSRCVFLYLHSV